MKTYHNPTLLLLFLAVSSCAQDPAQVTFRVRDDTASPVANANVKVFTFLRWVPGGTEAGRTEYDLREALTDTNGFVTITIPSRDGILSYRVQPGIDRLRDERMLLGDGREYYADQNNSLRLTNVADGRWQPWNPTVEIEVKPVLNPIPMYSRPLSPHDLVICKTPELSKAFGFDLMTSDWVAPFGKGKVTDFLIRVDSKPSVMPPGYYEQTPNAVREHDVTLSLSFASSDDGLQSVFARPLQGSTLRLPRVAPESGYQATYVVRFYVKDGRLIDETDRPDQNFFFRVRSRRDDKGNLTGALYGKIHGPIKFSSDGRLEFEYYLNPTPLDRNMEFDPKRNLLRP